MLIPILVAGAILLFLGLLAWQAMKAKREGSVEAIFETIARLLASDEEQNQAYPPQLQELLKPNDGGRQVGDGYGRCAEDPIRVNGPLGETTYISSLKSAEGQPVIGHRLGSVRGVDVYEVASADLRQWDLLFFDMYYRSKDQRVPSGFLKSPEPERALSAMTIFLPGFPAGFYRALYKATTGSIGVAAVQTSLKSLPAEGAERPPAHAEALQRLDLDARLSSDRL